MKYYPARLCVPVLLMLLSCLSVNAQMKGIIRDDKTGLPLSYVNIQLVDKGSGTSSDKEGRFSLPDTDSGFQIFVTATGYEPLQTTVRQDMVLQLHKANVHLSEVTVSSKRKSNTLKTGTYRKSSIQVHYLADNSPWILLRYFPYDSVYKNTPFLKSVTIQTDSEVKDAIFNVKLYRKDKNGAPGAFLYSENIIGHAAKGSRNTVVDLSKYDIPFPEEGAFIGIEFIHVEQNRYTREYKKDGKKETFTHYAPSIGAVPSTDENAAMIFENGKWKEMKRNNKSPRALKRYRDKYEVFAMELTLTN